MANARDVLARLSGDGDGADEHKADEHKDHGNWVDYSSGPARMLIISAHP
jgi:hypothetical protein